MCGRFTLAIDAARLAEHFALPEVPDLRPRYNIAPTQTVPVVRAAEHEPGTGGGRRLDGMRWGLVPSWADDPKIGNRLINARSETAASKPAFRSAFRRRRCLVPADGFFEWRAERGTKQPYWIHREDGAPFAMAGLWEIWNEPDGGELRTFTILTTEPNELVARLHDRMPVLLQPADYGRWLDVSLDLESGLAELFAPYPAELLAAHRVDRKVNSPANDSPDCIEQV